MEKITKDNVEISLEAQIAVIDSFLDKSKEIGRMAVDALLDARSIATENLLLHEIQKTE